MGALALATAVMAGLEWRKLDAARDKAGRDAKDALGRLAEAAAELDDVSSRAVDPQLKKEASKKSNFNKFFEEKATEARIAPTLLRISRRSETPLRSIGQIEYGWTLTVERATRQQIAYLCHHIEYYRRFLRVRAINMKRARKTTDDTWEKIQIKVAYREPLGATPKGG
ncbi:MAG: hypothetical protein ACYTGX_08270 [Planctomycetota bacterium]